LTTSFRDAMLVELSGSSTEAASVAAWHERLTHPAEGWPALVGALGEIEVWSALAADPATVEDVLFDVLRLLEPPSADPLEAELRRAMLEAPAWRCVAVLHGALERLYGAAR
jgi:hypothetical protein